MPRGLPGTLLIGLTTKPPSGFESANSWFVVGQQLIHYAFIQTKQCIKYLMAFPKKILIVPHNPGYAVLQLLVYKRLRYNFAQWKG